MAATTYFMLCHPTDHTIFAVSQADDFNPALGGGEVRSASFSADGGDSPDVLRAAPVVGDTYEFSDPTHTYTVQAGGSVKPCLKLEWSGAGAADPDDGVYEMISDGVNSMTLTARKWDMVGDAAIQEAGDKFEVVPVGATSSPAGTITLDANGEATLVFTPPASDKGALDLILRPINVNYCAEDVARARLV